MNVQENMQDDLTSKNYTTGFLLRGRDIAEDDLNYRQSVGKFGGGRRAMVSNTEIPTDFSSNTEIPTQIDTPVRPHPSLPAAKRVFD